MGRRPSKFYASRFPLVEVDFHLLLPAQREELRPVDQAHAARFTFDVKACSLLEQALTQPNSLYKDVPTQMPPGAFELGSSTATQYPDDALDIMAALP